MTVHILSFISSISGFCLSCSLTLICEMVSFPPKALWKGYLCRKKTDTAKTRALRNSLSVANQESTEEKKLYNRTALAIDRLLKYKHFSYILAALKDLG